MDDGDRKSKQGAKQPTTLGGKFMRNTDLYDRLEAQKQEELPTILTPAEVMDILGIGKNTVYRLLNSGQLPAVRIGRMWRIQLTSLNSIFPAQNGRY